MFSGPQDRKVLSAEAVNAYLSQALTESDKDKRQAAIDGLQQELNAQNAAYSIGSRPNFDAVRDGVTGFAGSGTGNEIYWGVDIAK